MKPPANRYIAHLRAQLARVASDFAANRTTTLPADTRWYRIRRKLAEAQARDAQRPATTPKGDTK